MIGESPVRKDAVEKAAGRTAYVADLRVPGLWHGVTVRAGVAAGRIRAIEPGPAFSSCGAVLLRATDIEPARNRVAMVNDEMPFLADREVRYLGEPIALVAAPTLERARAAARHIHAVIDSDSPCCSLEEAEGWRARDPDRHPPLAAYRITRGDAAGRIAEAREAAAREAGTRRAGPRNVLLVAGEYRTQAQEQAYIEPQGVIAWPGERGGAIIEGSLQCPFYVHNALVRLLACAPEDLIVRQTPTGGAFGGKEDFPSVLAGHAALLARACGHPVRMIYDRHEDILFTTKRHPSIVRHRTLVSSEGRLLAMEIEVLLDGGAYTTLSPVVLSRAVLHATGPYECEHVDIRGACLRTNLPPTGAFRGFGAPQVLFAIETHMDRIAEQCGLRPDEIRRRNLVRVGSTTATGQVLRESVSAERALDEALSASGFVEKWNALAREAHASDARGRNASDARKQRGIGLALVWHGGGFTGSGEVRLKSEARLTVEAGGRLLVRVANVEMGQGAHTALAQIAAQRLGVPLARVSCARPDTSQVPNSGPTVASRTVMVVGKLVERCAAELDDALRAAWMRAHAAPRPFDFDAALELLRASGADLDFRSIYEPPDGILWDDENYRGDAYAAFSYACAVAEVEVDRRTREVTLERITAVCDVGRAIHRAAVEGQIQGGTLQSAGMALLERMEVEHGRFAQSRFQTYILPTARDAPRIDAIVIEEPFSQGPFGAKGLGELPIHAPAPAIVNAIACATGVRICDLPATPEKILSMEHER